MAEVLVGNLFRKRKKMLEKTHVEASKSSVMPATLQRSACFTQISTYFLSIWIASAMLFLCCGVLPSFRRVPISLIWHLLDSFFFKA